MNHDSLPSTPHHGLARSSSALSLPAGAQSRLGSTSPLLIVNGPDDTRSNVPPLSQPAMNGATSSTSEVDPEGDYNVTSGSLQLSRSDSQELGSTEAATLQGLQRATAALESIKEQEQRRELSAVARARKTAAFRSPIVTSVLYRSFADTPTSRPISPQLRDASLTVTAGSSRATSPSRTPSGRAKRRKKERLPIPSSNPSLLGMDANDRRRSARVAKASATVPVDSASHTPNLSQFGFSPFLENLVMGAREHDRRTRSGVRATRPAAASTKAKRPPAKSKTKDKEPDLDNSELEAKKELFRQLCIMSYQLQAELGMVSFRTLDQIEADLDTPPPADVALSTANGTQSHLSSEGRGMFIDYTQTEPGYSQHIDSGYRRRGFSPDSSPEISLVDSMKARVPAYPSYHNDFRARRMDSDAAYYSASPPSPRPSRSNIMSISALMDGPAPKRPRYHTPTPEPQMTWTYEDDNASQILAELLAMKPKLDTTELDRLAQIVQLAAIDIDLPSRAGTPFENEEAHPDESLSLNPLHTLDVQQLFDAEEVEYSQEQSACGELYASLPHLSSFDEVVDEWRASQLSRLRLELQYRRSEIERIWTCDRKLAWSNFINDRAGELYRKQALQAHHQKWSAQMELDLLCVHRRKTCALGKLTEQIWLPKHLDSVEEKEKELYAKYGSFVYGASHAGLDDPLVRGDLNKLRLARNMQRDEPEQVDIDMIGPADGTIGIEQVVSDDDSSVSEYESDFSLSSGISSLPSFTSLSASPLSFGNKGADNEETASTSVNAESDDESDPMDVRGEQDEPIVNGDASHAAEPSIAEPAPHHHLPGRQKRKKPPPPGARLWKQGQVQHDELPIETKAEPPQETSGHADPHLYSAPSFTTPILKGDDSARRQQQQDEHDWRYAEQQQMLYEQQMYGYEHERHFYHDPTQPLYYAPHEMRHENGDVQQQRQYYASFHPHQQQVPPHAFAQVPTVHHSQRPY